MKKILTIILLLSIKTIWAQPVWQWAQVSSVNMDVHPLKMVNDQAGNIYIVGWFASAVCTFDTFNLHNLTTVQRDLFLVKYNSAGNLKWAVAHGAYFSDVIATGIDVDPDQNVYVCGIHSGSNLVFGNDTLAANGTQDSFLAKFDSSGNALWGKNLTSLPGNINTTYCTGLEVDANSNIYLNGLFDGQNLVLDTQTILNYAGHIRMFISKFDNDGHVIWAKEAGAMYPGSIEIVPNKSTQDLNGNIYIAGYYRGSNVFIGSSNLPATTSDDIFLCKYDSTGMFQWVQTAHGNFVQNVTSICCDNFGNVIVGGTFNSDSISFGSNIFVNRGTISTKDIFIAKYSTTGSLQWANQLGDELDESPEGMACDALGNLNVIGTYDSDSIYFGNVSILNPMAGSVGSSSSYYLANFNSNGNINWLDSCGEFGPIYGIDVLVNPFGLYITGESFYDAFFGTVHIPHPPAGAGSYLIHSNVTTGIEEKENKNSSIKVFPNPGNSLFSIKGNTEEIISLNVLDLSGRPVKSTLVSPSEFIIDTPGIYFLRIKLRHQELIQKIVVIQ